MGVVPPIAGGVGEIVIKILTSVAGGNTNHSRTTGAYTTHEEDGTPLTSAYSSHDRVPMHLNLNQALEANMRHRYRKWGLTR